MKSPISPHYRKKLDCGPTLLVREKPGHPVVAVNYWLATGSVNEEPEINGISHFFEHIFFKGTEKYPKGEMDRQVKAMGGYNNAATSYEFTQYYIVVPGWHLEKAVDLLNDALMNPAIRPADVENEKKIIREEIRRRDDNPSSRLFTLLQEGMFRGTPYALPILGREESLENICAPDLRAYFDRHYTLSNLVVVVAGDIKAGEVERVISGSIERESRIKAQGPGLRNLEIGPPERKKDRFEDKDLNQVYAAIGFHTPGIRDRALLPAFEVAATILGGGRSSRLYRGLLEREKLVSAISSWHMELRNAGIFGIDTVFRPSREQQVNQALFEEIRNVVDGGLEEGELERAKTILQTGFLYENETSVSLSGTLAYYEIEYGNADVVLDYLDDIDAVSADNVRQILEGYILEQPFARVVVGPKGER